MDGLSGLRLFLNLKRAEFHMIWMKSKNDELETCVRCSQKSLWRWQRHWEQRCMKNTVSRNVKMGKVEVLVAPSCPTLCNPMDCSPPGSSVHGILQARTLEWVAMPFSRGSSWPTDHIQVSCIAGGFFTIQAMDQFRHNTFIKPRGWGSTIS